MQDKDFGWLFIGAGSIARRVLPDLARTRGGYLAAICSGRGDTARALAKEHGARAYDDLEQAFRDPGVRAVYVATPNHLHRAHTLAALQHGFPVLCEKPFALSLSEADEMIDMAEQKNLLLMEGMWTRFNPCVEKAVQWAREGRIGRVLSLTADFAGRVNPSVARIHQPAMGGGALLDVGVYTVAMAQTLFGMAPERMEAVGTFTEAGVDAQCALTLRYQSGAIARLFSAIEVSTPHDAWIYGETGRIYLKRFWNPDAVRLITEDGEETYQPEKIGEAFYHEFNHFMDMERAGKKESTVVSHAYTRTVMHILDEAAAKLRQ